MTAEKNDPFTCEFKTFEANSVTFGNLLNRRMKQPKHLYFVEIAECLCMGAYHDCQFSGIELSSYIEMGYATKNSFSSSILNNSHIV